jgi:hypothetical protein
VTTLLFSHFGKKLPRYLIANIHRTAQLFPDKTIILVTDASLQGNTLSRSAEVLHPQNLNWPHFRPTINRDQRFWNGWWQKTFDRLLLIRATHERCAQDTILQVESDTILFPSFPFSELEAAGKIAYPLFSKSKGIGSIVFSPTVTTSKMLESSLLAELQMNPETTDMDALGSIASKLGSNYVRLAEFVAELDSSNTLDLRFGLFDGASHGEWLCGWDSRAHWGIGQRKRRTPNSTEKNMPHYVFEGSQIILDFQGKKVPLNNLHVHSKEMVFFDLNFSSKLEKIVRRVNNDVSMELRYFSIASMLFCLKSNLLIWSSSLLSKAAWKRLSERVVRKSPPKM